jgi:hypothetical protein
VEVQLYRTVTNQDPDSRYQIRQTIIQEAALPAMDVHNPVSIITVHGDIITRSQRLLRTAEAAPKTIARTAIGETATITIAGITARTSSALTLLLHEATARMTAVARGQIPVLQDQEATAEPEAGTNSSFLKNLLYDR